MFRKLASETPTTKPGGGNTENMMRIHSDQGFCCGEPKKDVLTYANTAHNLTGEAIASIEIDGTTYTFAAPAATQAALKTAIIQAFHDAYYSEVEGQGVVISGAANATVVTIKTTATLTKMVGASATDITLATS